MFSTCSPDSSQKNVLQKEYSDQIIDHHEAITNPETQNQPCGMVCEHIAN